MKTSEAGRALIARREGCRLDAYRDIAGVWTIGVGHTGRMAPPPVTPGMSISPGQSDELLAADLAPVEATIRANVKVPLTQNEYDALASVGFNIGIGGLTRSTILRRLNAGDIRGAADAFLMWNKPAALAARRAEERAQFLAPDAAATAVTSARVAILAQRADTARHAARTAQSGAAAMSVGGAAAVAIARHDHHHLPLIFGLLVLAAGCLTACLAFVRHRQARTLALNADAASATSFGSPAKE